MVRKQKTDAQVLALIDEESEEQNALCRRELTVEDIVLCPFCHIGVLNEYGACAGCHTILGAGSRACHVEDIEQVALNDFPDIGLLADANTALDQLTDIERKVVLHIVHGNETLEDLRELTGASRSTLSRIWISAKVKLQQALYEYSPHR